MPHLAGTDVDILLDYESGRRDKRLPNYGKYISTAVALKCFFVERVDTEFLPKVG